MTVYLDSNVFIYAAGRPHPYRKPCVAILEAIADDRLSAAASTEALQEILHLFQRRGDAARGAALVRSILELLPNVLPVEAADLRSAADLAERYPALPARDAVHAAIAIRRRLSAIVSADRHFDEIADIARIDPVDALRESSATGLHGTR